MKPARCPCDKGSDLIPGALSARYVLSLPRLERYEALVVGASDDLIKSRSNREALWASVTPVLPKVRHLTTWLHVLPRLSESETGDQQ